MIAHTMPTIVVRGVGVQGAQGVAGLGEFTMTAATSIHAGWAVAMDSAGDAYHPDRDVPSDSDRVIGVAKDDAMTGEPVRVVTLGPLVVGAWIADGPLYVDDDGSLTSTPPADRWQVQAAVAISATELFVDIKPAIVLNP